MQDQKLSVTIPMPLQIVVEDVGWWQPRERSDPAGPFGSGLPRPHCPLDYQALASLGEHLGMRPQLGFVACEWDRSNYLKKVPSATWMGTAWDNRPNIGPWLDEAADILRQNVDHLEIALHGIGHEYWHKGVRTRAEFHDAAGNMRPASDIESHLEAFGHILAENDLGPYPHAFIPPALLHAFGNETAGIQHLLQKFGVKTVTTRFKRAKQWAPPRYPEITWECGVLLMERGASPVPWYTIAAEPAFSFDRPVLSLHWSNLLHQNPDQNQAVVNRWIDFLKPRDDTFNTMLAPDSAVCRTQFVYQSLAEILPYEKGFEIDISRVKELPAASIIDRFYVKTDPRLPNNWYLKGGRLTPCRPGQTVYPCFEIRPDKHADSLLLKPAEKLSPKI